MINKVLLLGRLGKDPEIKTSSNGSAFANLTLATSESWKDKDGNKQEKTEWHRIVVFNDKLVSNVIEKYCKKGSLLYIEGSLQTRKYTDASGVEKYLTEVVIKNLSDVMKLLSFNALSGNGPYQNNYVNTQTQKQNSYLNEDRNSENEIPF